MSEATHALDNELAGSIALVTGGSRGIGLSIAQAMADGGATVAVVGRNGERAEQAARSLPGERHMGLACDVADPVTVKATVAAVKEALGPVDILVNNAGVTRDNLLIRMKDEDWDAVLETNLRGAFNMTRAVARDMMKRKQGVIINITSVVGLMGNVGQANYAASKAGLIGLTKSVARELASRKVRCNAIAPGYIETDMTAELGEEAVEQLARMIPMEHMGKPADIAGVARFLAGPWAGYITGQVIAADGGMVM